MISFVLVAFAIGLVVLVILIASESDSIPALPKGRIGLDSFRAWTAPHSGRCAHACSLQIGNGESVKSKIAESVKRAYGRATFDHRLIKRVQVLMSGEALIWPAFDLWVQGPGLTHKGYWFDSTDDPEAYKLECFCATIYSMIVAAYELQQAREVGGLHPVWICKDGDCCPSCVAKNRQVTTFESVLSDFPFHPSCNAMIGFEKD